MEKETAIKILKELHDKSLFAERTALETIIPELKKSEDEKIREELLEFLENVFYLGKNAHFDRWEKSDCSKWIAWIEKQKDISSAEYVFRPLAGCNIESAATQAVEQQRLGYKIVLAFNGAYIPVEEKTADDIVKEYYSWLEKQCYSKKDIDDAYLKGICNAKHELEKQGEQKPTSDTRYEVKADDSLGVNGKPFDDEHAAITQKDDERIRKELINAFSNREKYLIDQSFGDITVSEALAWLKKQGEQKPIISVAYMVSKYASTPEQGNEGFGKPMNCMVRAYRQGILDTLKNIRQNNVVEEQQNTTEQNTQKFSPENKSLSDKHQWEDGDIIRLKKDDGVRWQIFKSSESEMLDGWFMSQIMENGIAGGYVNSFILDAKYEFLHNPCKEFLKKR